MAEEKEEEKEEEEEGEGEGGMDSGKRPHLALFHNIFLIIFTHKSSISYTLQQLLGSFSFSSQNFLVS